MQYFYDLHGLILASEFAMPELDLRRRAATCAADLHIALGEFPAEPLTPTDVPYIGAANGHALMTIPGVGRYRVSNGREVLVEPETGVDLSLVRLFILGSVIGLVCHQRGLLPLHASAIEFEGGAIAFVGNPGQGKSTLAAHCLAHGPVHLVADDILVVSFDRSGRPWAHPGMPSVKLWRDALEALGQPVDGLRPDWLRADKFHLPITERLVQAPLPLSRVYVLDDDPDAGPGRIQPVSGAAAAAALIAHTYRVEYLDATAQRPQHFAASTRLAGAVAVRRLTRRRDLAQIGATVDAIFDDLRPAVEAIR
jgi:hypothetical protein